MGKVRDYVQRRRKEDDMQSMTRDEFMREYGLTERFHEVKSIKGLCNLVDGDYRVDENGNESCIVRDTTGDKLEGVKVLVPIKIEEEE